MTVKKKLQTYLVDSPWGGEPKDDQKLELIIFNLKKFRNKTSDSNVRKVCLDMNK